MLLRDVAEGGRVEQRGCLRRPTAVRCRVDDGVVRRYARLADVGAGGARVVTAAPPRIGARVELEFSLASAAEPIEAAARVVWRTVGYAGRGGVMGVVFESITGASRIMEYVEKQHSETA